MGVLTLSKRKRGVRLSAKLIWKHLARYRRGEQTVPVQRGLMMTFSAIWQLGYTIRSAEEGERRFCLFHETGLVI